MPNEVRIEGLRELSRGLKGVSKDVSRQFTRELRDAGEGVRALAEQKADSDISHIGPRWGRMRLGVTTRAVYIAPMSRRQGGSPRPNLAGLLVSRAMIPAAVEGEPEVIVKVEAMLERISVSNGFQL